jgi:hypothetical protein
MHFRARFNASADTDLHRKQPKRSAPCPLILARNTITRTMERQQQPSSAPADSNAAAGAAFRVVLCHLRGANALRTERQLARAACVCTAWRDEAGASEHHAVMRFPGPPVSRDVVARLLVRHAGVVTELRATFLLRDLGAALPPDAHFPRLTRVVECCAPSASAAPPPHAMLRAAPRLAQWLTGTKLPRINSVAYALADALTDAAVAGDAQEPTASLEWRGSAIVIASAMLDSRLFTPSRAAADARVSAQMLPPGAAGLLHMADAAAHHFLRRVEEPGPLDDCLLWMCHPGYRYTLSRLAALSGASVQHVEEGVHPLFMSPRRMSEALKRNVTVLMPHAERTLLHLAVTLGQVAAVAMLLHQGADPLDSGSGDGDGEQQCSPLVQAGTDTAECLAFAEHTSYAQSDLSKASDQLAVFWLLARVTAARHGDAALAAALPPALLALASPPPLSRFRGFFTTVAREPPRADGAHQRVAPGNDASMALLRVLEAEAYIRTGNRDARDASRAFRLRLAMYYAPHAALALAIVAILACAAWSAVRLALWLACAAMRVAAAAWRAAF